MIEVHNQSPFNNIVFLIINCRVNLAKEYLAQKRERLEKKIKQHLQSELQRANLNAAANADLSDIVSSLSGKDLLYFQDHPNKQVMRIKGNIYYLFN